MTFNDEQFASLQPYEQQMQSAIKANYGYIDSAKAQRVLETLTAAGVQTPRFKLTCGWCVMRLLKLAGKHYFADKEERASRIPLDFFVQKYEITYEDAKAAAERIGVEVVDGEVPAIKSEDICQEIREHVLGFPGGFAGAPAKERKGAAPAKKSAPKSKTPKAAKK